MRFLASAILPSLVLAHGALPGVPKLFGRNAIAELRNRNLLPPRSVSESVSHLEKKEAEPQPIPAPTIEDRAAKSNTDGQCGSGFGSCAAGYCCSPAGWCGKGIDYCAAPGCQFYYGSGCDQNTTPPGPSTSDIARTQLGSMKYGGAGIYDCVNAGDVAITYDDGPWLYTGHILDVLESYNAVATFFVTGNNNGKGEIDNAYNPWAGYIQRMDSMGCQVASHTWSHNNLDTEFETSADRKLNMYKNEMALRNILGKFPTYMRPPYSACSSSTGCEADMKSLGYNIVYFDLDTEDYLMDSTTLIQTSKDFFHGNLSTTTPSTGSWLVIGHDIHYQTAYNLTDYMLSTLISAGYKPVTVGECLGDPAENWYRTDTRGGVFTAANGTTTTSTAASSATSAPVATATIVSTTAQCGGTTGLTCAGSTFGNCCSASGWCGSTSDYCGTGCQSAFGLCGAAASSAVSSGKTSTTTTTTTKATSTPGSSVASSATAPASSLPVSTTAQCGAAVGLTCKGSTFGNCCSASGWCGSTDAYCGTGCQSGYGTCGTGASSVASSAASSSTATPSGLVVSSNAQCGGTTGQTCLNSAFGNCCSTSGWCGSTDAYCGSGCQSGFGSCGTGSSTTTGKSSTTTTTKPSTTLTSTTTTKPSTTSTIKTSTTTTTTKTSTATATPVLKVSTDGKCGGSSGETCKGSKYGSCCGSENTCGSVLQCIIGCQSAFGTCMF